MELHVTTYNRFMVHCPKEAFWRREPDEKVSKTSREQCIGGVRARGRRRAERLPQQESVRKVALFHISSSVLDARGRIRTHHLTEQKLWRARMSAFLMFPRRKAAELKGAGQERSASSGAPPRKRSPSAFSADVIASLLHLPLAKAASALGVSATSLKKICRHFGMGCWPYRRPCHKARGRLMLRSKLDGCDNGPALQQAAECRQNRVVHVKDQASPAMPVAHEITGVSPESPTVPLCDTLQPRCQQLSRASTVSPWVDAVTDAAVLSAHSCLDSLSSSINTTCASMPQTNPTFSQLGMEGTLWRPSVANDGPGADEGINETDPTTCGRMPQHDGDNTDDLEWILFGTTAEREDKKGEPLMVHPSCEP